MKRSKATRSRVVRVSEDSIHFAVADYLRRAWPAELPWFHPPNGGKREQITRTKRDGSTVTFSPAAQKLKRMGALAGVPDLVFVLPNAQAAFIELKAPDDDLSEPQIEFRAKALDLRCAYAVCRSPEEVEAVITRWLAAFGLRPRASLIQRRAAPLLDEARA